MKFRRFLFTAILLPLAAVGQTLDPALLLKPPTDAWPTYNGDYSGRRFSTLTQINQSTIRNLNLAWIYRANAGETPRSIIGGEARAPGLGSGWTCSWTGSRAGWIRYPDQGDSADGQWDSLLYRSR